MPAWSKKPLTEKHFSSFNVRADSLEQKPAYSLAWRKGQRCIIPATGFFEWPDREMMKPDEKHIEHYIHIAGQEMFSMAEIWDECIVSGTDKPLRLCAIITTESNAVIAAIPHTCMPEIFSKNDEFVGWTAVLLPLMRSR